jgi:hypothetical protein
MGIPPNRWLSYFLQLTKFTPLAVAGPALRNVDVNDRVMSAFTAVHQNQGGRQCPENQESQNPDFAQHRKHTFRSHRPHPGGDLFLKS